VEFNESIPAIWAQQRTEAAAAAATAAAAMQAMFAQQAAGQAQQQPLVFGTPQINPTPGLISPPPVLARPQSGRNVGPSGQSQEPESGSPEVERKTCVILDDLFCVGWACLKEICQNTGVGCLISQWQVEGWITICENFRES
jgi:hypothetical protein